MPHLMAPSFENVRLSFKKLWFFYSLLSTFLEKDFPPSHYTLVHLSLAESFVGWCQILQLIHSSWRSPFGECTNRWTWSESTYDQLKLSKNHSLYICECPMVHSLSNDNDIPYVGFRDAMAVIEMNNLGNCCVNIRVYSGYSMCPCGFVYIGILH